MLRLYLASSPRINLDEARIEDIKDYLEDAVDYPPATLLADLAPLLRSHYAVILMKGHEVDGLVTRADVLKLVTKGPALRATIEPRPFD